MTQPVKTSMLAIFSLVFSVLCFPIGLLLGVLAMGVLEGKAWPSPPSSFPRASRFPEPGVSRPSRYGASSSFNVVQNSSKQKATSKEFTSRRKAIARHGAYSKSLEEIEFVPRGETLRYQYGITQAGFGFVAVAKSTEVGGGDTWTMNNRNELANTMSGCR